MVRFHSGFMSLACIFIELPKISISTICERIKSIQQSFKFSFAICWGENSEVQWSGVQLRVPRGTCRLFLAESMRDANCLLQSLTSMMFDVNKLNAQKQYFISVSMDPWSLILRPNVFNKQESDRITSPSTCHDIIHEALTRMDIAEADIEAIHLELDCLADVMLAKCNRLQNSYLLTDSKVCERMANFFLMDFV